jgi:hypothetical protein
MRELIPVEPVDYLAIGHLAVDITPDGNQLGGSVAYAALTARSLGLRVGIVTSVGKDAPLEPLEGIHIVSTPNSAQPSKMSKRKAGENRPCITLRHRFRLNIFHKGGPARPLFTWPRLPRNLIRNCRLNFPPR